MKILFDDFDEDLYPGRPKILFIGLAESTHTHSWIDLLDHAEMNVRLFAMPSGVPPKDWPIRTYITQNAKLQPNRQTRVRLHVSTRLGSLYRRSVRRLLIGGAEGLEERWLTQIIRRWRPDVIHTLGLEPAAYFYMNVRDRFGLRGIGKWVVQVRGGPDLALLRLLPDYFSRMQKVMSECDQLIADNERNYKYAQSLGLTSTQIPSLGMVPGTGGVNVAQLTESWSGLPSQRTRLILWPKAYECPQSKALPVFEAIKLAWDKIQPCEVWMLASIPETEMWYWTLPEEIRCHCHIRERIPRQKVLQFMVQARVMLSPSLAEGTPNTMLEAMAAGAFPILSPLDTITHWVENERNVLFARNLYPEEIAQALCRAMTDDTLVDRAAERNLELVREIGDRSKIRPRVVEFYEKVAKQQER